jgi:hypothetical protein
MMQAAHLGEIYLRLIHHIQQQDDKAVITLGRSYLLVVTKEKISDPRVQEVQKLVNEAILREVVRLVHTGSEQEATTLLETMGGAQVGAPPKSLTENPKLSP